MRSSIKKTVVAAVGALGMAMAVATAPTPARARARALTHRIDCFD